MQVLHTCMTSLRIKRKGTFMQQKSIPSGPSEAVRHGGGRRTKNLQGERDRKKEEKGGKKEKRGERKESEEKGKKGRGEQERKMYYVLGLWV